MLKGILSSLAPTLVKAATTANPIAGMAVSLAAKRLGLPENASIEQIEDEVERNPDKMSAVQSAELEIKQIAANIEGFKLETQDRANARDHFATDWTPKLFAILSLVGFLVYSFMVTMTPDHDAGIVNLVIGYLGGLLSGISAFFFGSSNNGDKRGK